MDATKERSTFVTVVAWILIVLSGFGTLIAPLERLEDLVSDRPEDDRRVVAVDPDHLRQRLPAVHSITGASRIPLV